MTLHGIRPLMIGAPVTRVRPTGRAPNSGAIHEWSC